MSPTLHLVSGSTAAGVVREALRLAGAAEEVIEFRDTLAAGPLLGVDESPATRIAWWREVYSPAPFDEGETFAAEHRAWASLRASDAPIVIWHGAIASEHLFALQACWQLGPAPPRLFEARIDAVVGRPPSVSGSVAMHEPSALARLLGRAREISAAEARARAVLWERLRARPGAWFRELRSERVVHRAVDAYDRRLLNHCGGGEWVNPVRAIGHVLVEVAPVGDIVLAWRVRELIRSGRLEGQGGLSRLALPPEVRVPRET